MSQINAYLTRITADTTETTGRVVRRNSKKQDGPQRHQGAKNNEDSEARVRRNRKDD